MILMFDKHTKCRHCGGRQKCRSTGLQLLWQLHDEPGMLLDVLQLDALVRIRHKNPGDQIFALIAELHTRWEAVLCFYDALQQRRTAVNIRCAQTASIRMLAIEAVQHTAYSIQLTLMPIV